MLENHELSQNSVVQYHEKLVSIEKATLTCSPVAALAFSNMTATWKPSSTRLIAFESN